MTQGYLLAAFTGALALAVGLIIKLFAEPAFLLGYGIGAGLLFLNALGLGYAWPRILGKKSVALPILVIVSKHALSIGLIYWLTRPSNSLFAGGYRTSHLSESPWGGFALGIVLVVPAAVILALLQSRESQDETFEESKDDSKVQSEGSKD
jgi:hypothetical protein